MLSVRNVTKRYGARTAVSDASFAVERGEIVGFLGPNGAGKSTTLRMITGFLVPTAGNISVDGIDVLKEPLRSVSRIGYMPEGVPLYPELRVNEYLRHRAELKGVPRGQVTKFVGDALELAGVRDAERRIIGQLSKGYKQRVGLADALVADPPLLILDEPTSGLDPNQMRQVRELVRGFAGKKTVLVSTHILPEVEATCGRVVIIAKGHVVGEGATDAIRQGAAGQRVRLVVRGDRAQAEALLSSVEGVRKLAFESAHDEVCTFELGTEASPEVIERVVVRLTSHSFGVREVHTLTASLEDVFAQLTRVDAAAETPASQESPASPESPEASS
jgi:ABC-2 type transport system ATP-binding protein